MKLSNHRRELKCEKLYWLLMLLTMSSPVWGQDSLRNAHVIPRLDLADVFIKNKADPNHKLSKLSWAPGLGYSLQTGFAAIAGANWSWRRSEQPDSRFSSVTASVTYSQHQQTIFPIQANLWSKNEKWNLSFDWRFMQYPSETWGLAGRRDPNDGYTIDFSYLKFHQTALRRVARNLFVGAGIFYDRIWNIREVSAPSDGSTNFQRYGLYRDEIALSVPLRLLYDSRISQLNPSTGWYASLTYRDNLNSLGSNRNWQSLVLDVRKYFQVSPSGNTLAIWFYSWQSSLGTPYLLLPSTGWDDNFNTGRGYIQGRFRSNHMEYLEVEYRFNITRNGLLGGVAFANLQSFRRHLMTGANINYSAVGGGIRIKLNKKSGANLCIDYGIGQNGSHGFFINLGEVF